MKRFVFAGAVLALAPVAAFAQSAQDLGFAQAATHVDLTTITEGQNAVTSSSNPAVRNFAQQMVQYHTSENQTLASLQPPIPTSASPCMVWQAVLVSRAPPQIFDGAYLQATIYEHQRMVNVLQGEIQAGNDPNLKAFAQRALPAIQGHLAEAQQLFNGSTATTTTTTVRGLPARIVVRPNFQSGQFALSAADQQSLSSYAHQLTGAQQVTVTATGYTDTVRIGPELKREGIPTNEVLSEKRAESVKDYLVSQGVPAGEIETRGMGPANPVASNATESGRAQNRRVEVEVTVTPAPATSQTSSQTSSISSTYLASIPACN